MCISTTAGPLRWEKKRVIGFGPQKSTIYMLYIEKHPLSLTLEKPT